MTSVKPFKQENQRSYLYKREMKPYEPHLQTTTNELQVPSLGQVQTNAAGLNDLTGTVLDPSIT